LVTVVPGVWGITPKEIGVGTPGWPNSKPLTEQLVQVILPLAVETVWPAWVILVTGRSRCCRY
jgi:hypothetical protein